MRLHRALLGIVGLVAIGGTTACGAVAEAKAVNHDQIAAASVEVSPNRANPGQTITVRARCNDHSTAANVTSSAFGTIVARPSIPGGLLEATVNLPPTLQPGTFPVSVACDSGATATTKLIVVTPASVQPTMGPHTGGGALAGAVNEAGSAAPWLIGSAVTLALAGLTGLVSRRRRGPTRPADPSEDALVNSGAPPKIGPDQAQPPPDGDRHLTASDR